MTSGFKMEGCNLIYKYIKNTKMISIESNYFFLNLLCFYVKHFDKKCNCISLLGEKAGFPKVFAALDY